MIVLPTDAPTVTVTATDSGVSSGAMIVGIETIEQQAPKPIFQTIEPASSGKTGSYSGSTTTTTNSGQQLTGTALISALSAQIQGYLATGWEDQTIVDYFLTPGKPGYIQYPKLTKAQFKTAANGILEPFVLSNIK